VVDCRSRRSGRHCQLSQSSPPEFAASTLQRLYGAAKQLKAFPYAGRIGKKSGTRGLVLAPLPYLMIYAVDDQAISILRFLHAARELS
jgi:plasmid stabilization system protein ParE